MTTGSGYFDVSTFLLAERKPPLAAQICAASGLARYLISSLPAVLSVRRTATSPPPITMLDEPLMSGNGKKLKSVPGTMGGVAPVRLPSTKSPS